jgi:hypothetical protein
MAGDSLTNMPSVISGWTAFSNPAFVKGTLADMQATATTTGQINASTDAADVEDVTTQVSQINNDLSDVSPSDSEPTQQEKDDLLLADPPRNNGAALVDLASRYSTADIVDLSNEATGGNLTRPAINSRLNAALTKKSKATGTTKFALKEELTELRKARGIRSTRREPDHRHAVVSDDTRMGGDETSGGGPTQTPENDQVDDSGQVKSASQVNPAIVTSQSKEADTAKENSYAGLGGNVQTDASLAAQQQADREAFQDQNSLKGDKILLIAERYSNADISARIREILGNYPLTESGVATRVHVALEKKAKATGVTMNQVRDDLNAARIASGAIKPTPRGRGLMRSPRGVKAIKTPVTVQDDDEVADVDEQSAGSRKSVEPPKKRSKGTHDTRARLTSPVATPAAVDADAEMTDNDSAAGSQDGHGPDAVEAANILLEMAGGGPEVREVATALMHMHKEDALLVSQSVRTE